MTLIDKWEQRGLLEGETEEERELCAQRLEAGYHYLASTMRDHSGYSCLAYFPCLLQLFPYFPDGRPLTASDCEWIVRKLDAVGPEITSGARDEIASLKEVVNDFRQEILGVTIC